MILSSKRETKNKQFEELLSSSQQILEKKNKSHPPYFSKRTPTEFEKDVHAAMEKASIGTPFEGTIQLVSGHRFPDIIDDGYYGVEVKTTKTNWKSTGNSVLESTRVDKIERIYLFFGRLSDAVAFKFRRYEECLHEVAVTHSPRYLIDMNLDAGKSIFDKMKISYDELRKLDKPIKPFVQYYRSIAQSGEEPWWMEGADDEEETLVKPTVSLWNSLPVDEQETMRNQAMALFPEVFSNRSTKYHNLSLWLATRKGVVDSSLRDRFTAGGRETLIVNGKKYKDVPKIFYHLKGNLDKVVKLVKKLDPEEAKYFWKVDQNLGSYTLLPTWLDLVVGYAEKNLGSKGKFIVHLIGDYAGEKNSSLFLKEEMAKYGLDYS
ncbi:MAG: hypothetical protein K8S27_13930 [Candidatus Omnitrophica bacterium]|nr:hypothetical protein [Candidatus Omnitrophota bacterium]